MTNGTRETNPTFMPDSENWFLPEVVKNSFVEQGVRSENNKEEIDSNSSEYFDVNNGDVGGSSPRPMLKRDSPAAKSFRERQHDRISVKLGDLNSGGAKKWSWLRIRYQCGNFVNHPKVQTFVIFLIIINAVLMGIGTYFDPEDDPRAYKILKEIDKGFLYIYTVEIVMQIMYYGWRVILDAWLVFDLVVVIVSWLSDVIMPGGGGPFQIIRAFRIFRALRLLARVKTLRDLVAAIGQVIPNMISIFLLMLLIFYIFAVLFTQLFRDVVLEDYFGEGRDLKPFKSLHVTFFTCLELMTLEWSTYTRAAMEDYPDMASYSWIFFILFIFISGFIIANLVIAVICNAVAVVDDIAREREAAETGEVLLDTTEQQLEYCQNNISSLSERVDSLQETQKNLQALMELMSKELSDVDGCTASISNSDQNTFNCDDDDSDEKLTSQPFKKKTPKSTRRISFKKM